MRNVFIMLEGLKVPQASPFEHNVEIFRCMNFQTSQDSLSIFD